MKNSLSIDRIKNTVPWRDLIRLTRLEKFIENTLCFPWLIASLFAAYNEAYLLAIPLSGMYFLTALRQSHNAYHNALGINPFWTQVTLHFNSVFMLASLHAIKTNHMKHHTDCLQAHDYEKTVADMTWWRALLHGPAHWWHNHRSSFVYGTKTEKRLVVFELTLLLICVAMVFYLQIDFLLYHIAFMLIAEMMMPFFTIWISHHGHTEHTIANLQRNRFLNFITMNMMLHFEHHLFPAVPSIKLGELARRVDEVLES